MFEIKGKYANALITTMNIEEEAIGQITELVNHKAAKGSQIAIMPDVHAGAGCVIGTVMKVIDRVVPNLVGVDIGCGVFAVEILAQDIDYAKLDKVIRKYVPHGFGVHRAESPIAAKLLQNLKVSLKSDVKSHISKSLGTLGGGNHFISVEADGDKKYLCIHSGSRNLGVRVAKFYQELASKTPSDKSQKEIIEKLKAEGKTHLIQETLSSLKAHQEPINKDLAFLVDCNMQDYLADLKIAQEFANQNRKAMRDIIFYEMGWKQGEEIHSVHNYIDTETMILRKGAVAAPIGELFLVPLNMKDGTLICRGSANDEWLQSAPHGAGRAMSRRKAKDTLSMESFSEEMSSVWTTSVNQSTLDEAPGAYKPADEIKSILSEKYEVVAHLRTLYNFKSSEETE